MAHTIQRVSGSVKVGDAPHWDVETQSLYYVDAIGKFIHKFTPSTNQHTKAYIGTPVAFVIPVDGSDGRFVINMYRELVVVTWDGISTTVSLSETIAHLDKYPLAERDKFCHGKADPTGRLWAGTVNTQFLPGYTFAKVGLLYSLGSDNKLNRQVFNVAISHGFAWNATLNKFYYIDSARKRIDQYDFDPKEGSLSKCQTVFTLERHGIEGFPLGETIDADGNLWIAIYTGGKVIKIDPRIPETLLNIIEVPVKQVTSVTFGGPNLDELYVTTAKLCIDVCPPPEEDGSVYKITGFGVAGLPGARVKL